VLNLLPIPVLDGGHLLFFAIEAVKGSPVSEKFQIALQQVGILLLLSLMVLALFLDLERLFQ
jgi:Predicted membrane-associated Zn-dependent proteases 1